MNPHKHPQLTYNNDTNSIDYNNFLDQTNNHSVNLYKCVVKEAAK